MVSDKEVTRFYVEKYAMELWKNLTYFGYKSDNNSANFFFAVVKYLYTLAYFHRNIETQKYLSSGTSKELK